jgi:hypothetical protein
MFISCKLQQTTPPYIISGLVCSLENKPGYYTFAGVEFDFMNISEKDISSIAVSFMVYDAVTESSPFIGSNIIKIRFDGKVKPQKNTRFIVSLDPYIYIVPKIPYIIDYFYIAEIVYEDGEKWEDSYGIYAISTY